MDAGVILVGTVNGGVDLLNLGDTTLKGDAGIAGSLAVSGASTFPAGTSISTMTFNSGQIAGGAGSSIQLFPGSSGSADFYGHQNAGAGLANPNIYLHSYALVNASDVIFQVQNGTSGPVLMSEMGDGTLQVDGGVTVQGVVNLKDGSSGGLGSKPSGAAFYYNSGTSTWTTAQNLQSSGGQGNFNSVATQSYMIFVNYGLFTCTSAYEGSIVRDNTSGISTGHKTRLCLCESNGSATYAWQNVVSGTVGTSTTCSD
jgi:hypothetical protein